MKNILINRTKNTILYIPRYIHRKLAIILDLFYKKCTEPRIGFYLKTTGVLVGFYISIYTIALARYELALFTLDSKISNLYTLSTGDNPKRALERIPLVQQRKIPSEPRFFNILTTIVSLTDLFDEHNNETILELRQLLISYKENLSNIILDKAILPGTGSSGIGPNFNQSNFTNVSLKNAKLNYNSFQNSRFTSVNFDNAKMKGCNFAFAIFVKSNLLSSDFSGSNLCGVQFIDTKYTSANFTNSNLVGADLSRVLLNKSDSLMLTGALYNSKPIIFNENNLQWNVIYPKYYGDCIQKLKLNPTKFPAGLDPKSHGMLDISDNDIAEKILQSPAFKRDLFESVVNTQEINGLFLYKPKIDLTHLNLGYVKKISATI